MKLLSALTFLAAAQFSTSALAIDNYHVECESCVSGEQFTQAAKDHAIFRETVFINVMNIDNYEMKKYSVYKNSKTVCDPNGREPDGEGGFIRDCWLEKTLTADEVSLTNTELNNFTDFASATNNIKNTVKQRSIEVPITVVPNAYDLVGASFNETAVTNYFNSIPLNNTIVQQAISYVSSASKMVTTGIVINSPPLVFSFSDGTKAYAVPDFIDMDDRLHFKFILVTDVNGNKFDLKSDKPFSKYINVANLSLTSWQSLLTAFRGYGLAVIGASTKIVPRGTVKLIDCAGSTEYVCRHPL